MACKINQKLSITNFNAGTASRIKYLVIHYVGATGGAEANCNYFYSTYRGASAHYFVGHSGEIWQCVLDKNIAWHCGTSGSYYHRECRNSNAIGIEMCCRKKSDGTWYFEDATVKSTIELAKEIMAKYNIPIGNVLRHYDVTHKCCPEPYVRDISAWNAFKAQLTASTPSSTTVKKYTLVTEVNKYSNADNAANRKNPLSTKMTPGTYQLYYKYPNGYNGMYNLTTDPNGAAPGSWINPAENVAPTATPTEQMYRVRKEWSDAKTQKGAYKNLDNAKACADTNASEGYKVFDNSGNLVYTGVVKTPEPAPTPAPVPTPEPVPTPNPTPIESPKEEIPVTAVYDLDYPIKTNIVNTSMTLTMRSLQVNCATCIEVIKKNNPNFNPDIAKAFFNLAPKYHIDPMMAISQSILETGWFKFEGSSVKPEQNNYCGLGATGNGASGAYFYSIEEGVRAQLQHLYAYGSTNDLPEGETCIADPRFKYVTRGIATYWQQLAGRWAVPGYDKNIYSTPQEAMEHENTYGQKILAIQKQLSATLVSDEIVEKYFPTETDPVIPNTPNEDKKEDNTSDTNNEITINEKLVSKIVRAIVEFLKALFTK